MQSFYLDYEKYFLLTGFLCMAFERVLDLKTGRESWVDFLPASTWISSEDAHWKNWTGRRHNHATLSDLGSDKSYRPEVVARNRHLSVVSNSLETLIPTKVGKKTRFC
ncbi:hypothetical protein [Vibrio cholerae]|uniref:hypothetical protein n=1 Tax=Vibrio cholerae TaxID=666 RepID=UPI00165E7BAB|nr:hypothetical protein [Vibrio cholerae]